MASRDIALKSEPPSDKELNDYSLSDGVIGESRNSPLGFSKRLAPPAFAKWKGGRVAEGARLESVFTLTGNVGSNPTPSVYSNTAGTSGWGLGNRGVILGSRPQILILFSEGWPSG